MSSLYTIYNFYLNTRYRTSGTPNNADWLLQNPITLATNPQQGEWRCKIMSACIPFSFHQFNAYNYTTFVVYNGTVNTSFIVSTGNYNILTYADEWTLRVNTLFQAIDPTFVMSYTYNFDGNLLTYTYISSVITSINFLNTAGSTQCNLSNGFNTAWSMVSNTAKTSDQACNVSPARNLYIFSNSLIQNKSYDGFVSPIRTSNVLECINIETTPYQYIQFRPNNSTISVLTNFLIDRINLSVQDESEDIPLYDLVLNWSIHLVFEHWIYDKPQYSLEDSFQNQLDATAKRDDDLKKMLDDKQRLIELNKNSIEELKSLHNIKTKKDVSKTTDKEPTNNGEDITKTSGTNTQ